jgi:hypothetical protein
MLPCFAKLLQVSQDKIFAIFVFCESYNFRKTHEIRLTNTTEQARGFKKSGKIENHQCIYNLLNT